MIRDNWKFESCHYKLLQSYLLEEEICTSDVDLILSVFDKIEYGLLPHDVVSKTKPRSRLYVKKFYTNLPTLLFKGVIKSNLMVLFLLMKKLLIDLLKPYDTILY